MRLSSEKFIPFAIFIIMFVGVQATLKLNVASNYLSASLSDLILPVVCTYCFFVSLRQRDFRWIITKKYIHLAFGLVFLWLSFSLFRSFEHMGSFSSWGFFNRLIGWLVVVAYFWVGVFLSQKVSVESEIRLCKVLLVMTCLMVVPGFINYIEFLFGGNANHRLSNFGQNPNSLSFSLLILLVYMSIKLYVPYGLTNYTRQIKFDVCFVFLFSTLIFASSRAAFVSFIIMMAALLFLHRPIFLRLAAQFCSALIISLLILNMPDILKIYFPDVITNSASAQIMLIQPNDFVGFQSAQDPLTHRYQMFLRAISLWQENKLFGIGLGSWLILESQLGNLHTLHNTIIWSLTELGIIGLLLIGCIYAYFFSVFLFSGFTKINSPQCIAGLSILIFALVYSQANDILYQRPLWLLLGFLMGGFLNKPQASND